MRTLPPSTADTRSILSFRAHARALTAAVTVFIGGRVLVGWWLGRDLYELVFDSAMWLPVTMALVAVGAGRVFARHEKGPSPEGPGGRLGCPDEFAHGRMVLDGGEDVPGPEASAEADGFDAHLAAMAESSDVAIIGEDLDGLVIAWNAGAARIFGYAAGEILGRPIRLLIPEDRQHEEAEILKRIRRGKHVGHYESVRITRDGRHIDVSLTIVPDRNGSGSIIGHSAIARDITGHKSAEKRLRDCESLLQAYVDNAPAAIAMFDGEMRYLMVSRHWLQDFGLNEQDLIGRSHYEVFPEIRSEWKAVHRRALAGEVVRASEDYFERADGHSQWIAWETRPWFTETGGVGGILIFALDITERKEAQDQIRSLNESLERRVAERTAELAATNRALVESEGRFRGAFDASVIGMALIATDGRFLQVNDSLCLIVGYSREELLDRTLREISHPEDIAEDLAMARRTLDGEGSKYSLVKRCFHKDGHTVWIHLSASLVYDSEGRPIHFVSQIEDITARKQTEDTLLRARDEALAAASAKSMFLANMSHEIRTPMNGVIGMIELLLETPLNELQRGYAETILSSGEALLTVVNDILDLSKIEAGKLTLECAEFDLRDLMEEVARLLAPRAHQKGLRISSRVAPEVPGRLVGDAVRIRQVLTNLAGNAVKFTERGRVDLEACVLAEAEAEAMLRILVRDTGIGIPEDQHDRIFQSFTQVDGRSNRKHGGTGLGLTICRNLAALMGGRIGLESRPGLGSAFWIELTLGKRSVDPGPSCAGLESVRVLVVNGRDDARETLLSMGCRVEAVGSSGQALAKLLAAPDDDPYDVIFVGHDATEVDGPRLATAIKATPRFTGVPIVLLTSRGGEEAGEDRSSLFSATLSRPVRRSHLHDVIQRLAISRGRRRDPRRESAAGAEPPLAPSRVLLAEDNDVNRRVALSMLERLGVEVVAVENGRQALEAMDRGRFDLILMDLQMPEVDGYAATSEIRRREAVGGGHIPIVAVTAHAMSTDRERCLAAGMDDYLSKPLRPAPLREALLRWGPGKVRPETEIAHDRPSSRGLFDPDVLVETCGGTRAAVREILGLAFRRIPDGLEEIKSAVAKGDGQSVRRRAHSLKGVFLTIGAATLADACQDLIILGQRGEWAEVEAELSKLNDRWGDLHRELRTYLEEESSGPRRAMGATAPAARK
jgi:PAS domain S-box-containing protein